MSVATLPSKIGITLTEPIPDDLQTGSLTSSSDQPIDRQAIEQLLLSILAKLTKEPGSSGSDSQSKSRESPGDETTPLQVLSLHSLPRTQTPSSTATQGTGAPISSTGAGIGDAIKDIFVGIGNGIKHFFTGLGHGIKDFFTGHFGNAIRDVVGGAQSAFSDVTSPIIKAPATIVNDMGLGDTKFGQFVNKGTNAVNGFLDKSVNTLTNAIAAPGEHLGDFEDHLIRGDTKDAVNSLKDFGISEGEALAIVGASVATGGAADAVLPEAASLLSTGLNTAATTGARFGGDTGAERLLGLSSENEGINN